MKKPMTAVKTLTIAALMALAAGPAMAASATTTVVSETTTLTPVDPSSVSVLPDGTVVAQPGGVPVQQYSTTDTVTTTTNGQGGTNTQDYRIGQGQPASQGQVHGQGSQAQQPHTPMHGQQSQMQGQPGKMPAQGVPDTQSLLPKPMTSEQGVEYISGGVGDASQKAMNSARGYNLKLTFAAPTGEYLADVQVRVVNAKGQTVLDTVSTGPLLYAKLPAGSYRVTAAVNGQEQTRKLTVSSKKAASTAFTFKQK
ncbi:hypothetical protein [Gulbenkiania mobilis]|uniref:Carboxypeptidase regulatory-like domain-containing protein n=1 Tax=Gulbenkiania mobilis TaxID=397457 RepID=A0ABY2CVU2_GULMO|nr:hypothetical protein EV669_10673 [Gulbenkiania mobilis]